MKAVLVIMATPWDAKFGIHLSEQLVQLFFILPCVQVLPDAIFNILQWEKLPERFGPSWTHRALGLCVGRCHPDHETQGEA